jgi:nicotinamidase-related amidase
MFMRVLKEESVAVIVDVQERLFPHMHKREGLEKSLLTLIRGLRVLDIPLLVTQQYTKGLGPTIPTLHEPLGEYTPIEKRAFSCMDEKEFTGALEQSGKRRVILAGIETHVCVMQTAIDMMQQGYIAVIVEDCVSSRKQGDKETALSRLREEGAVITSYESILFELLRYSGTDTFREISKLVK